MKKLIIYGLVFLLTAATFLFDMATPRGFVAWILYVIPLFMVSKVIAHSAVYVVTSFYSLLIILGYILSPPGVPVRIAIANRLLGIVVIWVMMMILVQRQRVTKELQETTLQLKAVNEELKRQAELLNLTRDAIFVRDVHGIISFWNLGAELTYGWQSDEALGKNVHDILDTQFPKALHLIISDVERNGVWEGELVHKTREGKTIIVSSRWGGKRDSTGRVSSILEINTDITWQKETEAHLKEAYGQLASTHRELEQKVRERTREAELKAAEAEAEREKLRKVLEESEHHRFQLDAILNQMNEGLVIFNPEGQVDMNRAAREMHEFDANSKQQFNLEELADLFELSDLNGKRLPVEQWPIGRVLQGETLESFEVRVQRRDTGKTWVGSYGGAPVRDKNGNLLLSIVTLRDVTERKRDEEALRESEEKFRKLFELLPHGVILIRPDNFTFVLFNDEAARMLGYSHEEYARLSIPGIEALHKVDQIRANFARFMAGEKLTFETRHMAKSGEFRDIFVAAEKVTIGGEPLVLAVFSDITERKRVEEALRESEERLRLVIETVPQLIWTTLPDGSVDYCNDRWLSYTGLTMEQVQGSGWMAALHPDDKERTSDVWLRSCRENSIYEMEQRLRGRDGNYKWFLARAEPLRDKQGMVVKWYGTCTDIEGRKRAEEALKQSEQEYITLAENSPEVIARFDRQLRHTYVNEYGARVYGLPKEKVLGRTNADLGMPAERVAFWRQHFDEVFASGQQQIVDFEFDSPSTGHQYFSSLFVPEFNERGEVMSILAITRDITPIRQAEQALRDSEDRLRLAVEATGLGTFDFYPQTGRLIWSELTKRHFGLPPDADVDYDTFLRGLHPEDRERMQTLVEKVLRREEGSLNTEYRTIGLHDGVERWLTARGVVFLDKNGKPVRFIGATIDITERKAAERRLVEERSNLQRAYDELKTFSYSVAHDLRTPLRSISNFSQLLIRKYGDEIPNGATHYLQRITDNISRMGFLIDGLLNLSFISRYQLKLERVNLSKLAASVVENLRAAEPEREVKVSIKERMYVLGDPYLLRVLLENLFGNAWKYTKARAVAEVDFTATIEDERTIYCVRDNGVGFNMAFAHKLFQPFQRLHGDEIPGTGVGLATVKRIVDRHRGSVWATAPAGGGAVFCFTLMVSRGEL